MFASRSRNVRRPSVYHNQLRVREDEPSFNAAGVLVADERLPTMSEPRMHFGWDPPRARSVLRGPYHHLLCEVIRTAPTGWSHTSGQRRRLPFESSAPSALIERNGSHHTFRAATLGCGHRVGLSETRPAALSLFTFPFRRTERGYAQNCQIAPVGCVSALALPAHAQRRPFLKDCRAQVLLTTGAAAPSRDYQYLFPPSPTA